MSLVNGDLQEIHAAARGFLEILAIMPGDGAEMAAAAAAGNDRVAVVLNQVAHLLEQVGSAPKDDSYRCTCCSAPIRIEAPFAMAIARPLAEGTPAIGMAVCLACGPTREAAQVAGMKALKHLWPSLKAPVVHPKGNA